MPSERPDGAVTSEPEFGQVGPAAPTHAAAIVVGGDPSGDSSSNDDIDVVVTPAAHPLVATRLLAACALTGVIAIAGTVLAIGGGAALSSWVLEHAEGTRAHPAIVAVVVTSILSLTVVRAVPWAQLARWCMADGGPCTDTATNAEGPGEVVEAAAATLPAQRGLDRLGAWPWRASVAVFAIGLALLVNRNLWGDFHSRTLGFAGDRDWYVYVSWKIGQALRHGASPFRLTGLNGSHGFNLFVGDGFLPPLVTGVANLLMGPVAAYNLVLGSATVFSAASGVYLSSVLTRRRIVKLLVAGALALAPVYYVRYLGHFSLSFTFPVALVLAEGIVLARDQGPVRGVRLTIWLLIAFGCSVYLFLACVGILAVSATWRLAVDTTSRRVVVRRLGASLGVVGLVMSPFLVQRSHLTSAELRAGSFLNNALRTDGENYNTDVLAAFVPTFPTTYELPGRRRFERNVVVVSGEGNYAFPGLALVVLGIGGLVAFRLRAARVALLAGGLLWVLALGPVADVYGVATVSAPDAPSRTHWLPFEVLAKVPMLSTLRAPGRLMLALPAVLAVGMTLALDAAVIASARSGQRRWLGALPLVVVVVAILPSIPSFSPTPLAVDSDSAKAMLRGLASRSGPPGSVLPVPSCEGDLTGIEASLQIWHHLPSVGCQGPYLAIPFASEMEDYRDSADLAALRCSPGVVGYVTTQFDGNTRPSEDLTELRRDFGVRYMVVDRASIARCPRVQSLVAEIETRFEVLPGDERWAAIDLESPRLRDG